MRRRLAASWLIAALPLAAARAGDQPTTTPTRDVDVTYRLAAPANAAALEQRVRWQASTGRQRIDPPTPGLYIIVDPRAHRLASVRPAEKLALEIDQGEIQPFGGSARASYVRGREDTVAGLACTVWQADTAGDAPQLCFTADGVLLRVASGGRVMAEAERVVYAPIDPADFEVPPGYRRVTRDAPKQPPP